VVSVLVFIRSGLHEAFLRQYDETLVSHAYTAEDLNGYAALSPE
jgi:hypothetical protein